MASLEVIEKRLADHIQTLSASEFLASSFELLRGIPFKRIRCLALGSPTLEFQALFQLAYLKLIAKEFEIPLLNVSLYDPVFTADDEHLLSTIEHYIVEDKHIVPKNSTPDILYFMPHAPRSVTNLLLHTAAPIWILGNDVRVTMGTLSKLKFLLEYPYLAKLVHLSELGSPRQPVSAASLTLDEFTVVRRKKKRPGKNVYVEPELDYDLVEVYFDHVTISRIESPLSAPWSSSFSDLALNVIRSKDGPNDIGEKEPKKEGEQECDAEPARTTVPTAKTSDSQ